LLLLPCLCLILLFLQRFLRRHSSKTEVWSNDVRLLRLEQKPMNQSGKNALHTLSGLRMQLQQGLQAGQQHQKAREQEQLPLLSLGLRQWVGQLLQRQAVVGAVVAALFQNTKTLQNKLVSSSVKVGAMRQIKILGLTLTPFSI
jgi:hypothetical protein